VGLDRHRAAPPCAQLDEVASASASELRRDGFSPEPDTEAITALIERAVNGPELPDYQGVPDSGTTADPPPTLAARS
jgi:hypothetical protein